MLAVKNFSKFQHYKDRSPVWIKLYRSLLRDYDFAKLPDAARGQLVLIWLLASEMGNRLPNDAEWIKCQINATEPVNIAILLETGFLVDCDSENAINHNASDDASLEKRERREEKEREKKARPTQSDEEWLAELQANPAYAMLDVRLCYCRAVEWCKVNNRQPTRKFFINWLGREHKPMTAKASPPKKPQPGASQPSPAVVAANLDGFSMDEYIDNLIAVDDLIHLGQEYDKIVQQPGGAKAEWEIRCVSWYELHRDEPATPEQMAQLFAARDAIAKRITTTEDL